MGLKKNGFTKIVLAVALFAVLGAAIPQEKAFAQAGVTSCSIHENTFQANCQECMVVHRNLQRLLRHEQQQLLLWQQEQLRQQLQKQQRQNVVWQIQIVNANTFERIGDVTRVIARGVSSLDEARWNARRQLGFPADSDLRTAGGVPQRIIWGEPQRYDQPAEETAPGQFTAPEAPDPLRGLLPLPRRTTLAPTAPAEVEIAAPVVPAAPTPQPAVAAAQRRSGRTDWLSFEVRTWGAGIRYDRNINDIFSVGATFGGGTGIDQINSLLIGAMLATRFFPRGSPFYFELGIGYGHVGWGEEVWFSSGGGGFYDYEWFSRNGVMIVPAIGLRLGAQTRSFFVNPYISVPVIAGRTNFQAGVGLGYVW